MCGIAGFIGESKNPEITYTLITELFKLTEIRGDDASGFWGTESGDGNIIYHKEPVKSTKLAKSSIWKKVKNINPNLLLTHCRATTPGVGMPSVNNNNHPFASSCKNIGLIHNGNISKEYHHLKEKFEVVSRCDSEILLRIFESSKSNPHFHQLNPYVAKRLNGLKDIWSYIDEGSMGVAIGERLDDARYLWLFRNSGRPIWVIDLREKLGQFYFCSTPEIWDTAVGNNKILRDYIGCQELFELPTEEIWQFGISSDMPIVTDDSFHRYNVTIEEIMPWEHDDKKVRIQKSDPHPLIITELDENDEPLQKEYDYWTRGEDFDEDYDDGESYGSMGKRDSDAFADTSLYDFKELEERCCAISDLITDIHTRAENDAESFSPMDFEDLLRSLETTQRDLEATVRILDK